MEFHGIFGVTGSDITGIHEIFEEFHLFGVIIYQGDGDELFFWGQHLIEKIVKFLGIRMCFIMNIIMKLYKTTWITTKSPEITYSYPKLSKITLRLLICWFQLPRGARPSRGALTIKN